MQMAQATVERQYRGQEVNVWECLQMHLPQWDGISTYLAINAEYCMLLTLRGLVMEKLCRSIPTAIMSVTKRIVAKTVVLLDTIATWRLTARRLTVVRHAMLLDVVNVMLMQIIANYATVLLYL
jgi:hypothetical protein